MIAAGWQRATAAIRGGRGHVRARWKSDYPDRERVWEEGKKRKGEEKKAPWRKNGRSITAKYLSTLGSALIKEENSDLD